MLRRLVNLPFSVATRAAKAFQDREDAKIREKYGPTRDPGDIAGTGKVNAAPNVHSDLDPAAVRMEARDVRRAQADRRNVVIVDVRESTAGERIPGALHMALSEVSIRVSELSDDQLVVVWGSEEAAQRAVFFFRERGIEDSWVLAGGIASWKSAGGPVEGA